MTQFYNYVYLIHCIDKEREMFRVSNVATPSFAVDTARRRALLLTY